MSLMTLEIHFPSNWAYEGTVDVLYLDPTTKIEKSYGTLSQGSYMLRETFNGHRWMIREQMSRELLMSVAASQPAGGGPQIVTVGSDGGLDPLKASLWRMGGAPREPLLKTVEMLLKVLGNVLKAPNEYKYRTLRAANEKVAACLDVPGALAFLSCAGFEQAYVEGEARLVLPSSRPTAPVEGAAAQLRRLEALLKGLPAPSESAASMQASQAAAAAASQAMTDEPSHR